MNDYAEENLIILICPRRDLWDHKPARYRLSHPDHVYMKLWNINYGITKCRIANQKPCANFLYSRTVSFSNLAFWRNNGGINDYLVLNIVYLKSILHKRCFHLNLIISTQILQFCYLFKHAITVPPVLC